VLRHWQKFTMTTVMIGADGAVRRRCVSLSSETDTDVRLGANNESSRGSGGGGVPPGGTARAMPDSFPIAMRGSVRELGDSRVLGLVVQSQPYSKVASGFSRFFGS
jgi:hypothetical protein